MESPANVPEQAQYSRESSLENFPSEIKVMILCHMPDVSSLSSIVHASPTYHQAYFGAREEILHVITTRTLQKNNIRLLEPWTAIHAPQLGHHIPHRIDIITKYLESYAQGRMDGRGHRLVPQDSLAILSLHRKFTVLIKKFCDDNLRRNPFTGLQTDDAAPLAQSESHRLFRAFWRYEIYSKLFGPSSPTNTHQLSIFDVPPRSSTDDKIARKFFELFPNREVEELACLRKYTEDTYRPFRKDVTVDVDLLIAHGPKFLYEVLTASSEDERNYRIAQGEKIGWVPVDITMQFVLDAYQRDVWREIYDNLISARIPTTGWQWASSRGVQNTDFRLRRWWYVFWDQERVERWGYTEENGYSCLRRESWRSCSL